MYKLVLFCLCLWCQVSALAQSYYVCQSCSNASDANNGFINAPWKTIGRACRAGAVPAGSTVYIQAGKYIEKLTINVAGSAGLPITFRPYNADAVQIDGGSTAGVLLTIQNKSYLTFQNLIFQNAIGSGSDAIQVSGNARNITIQNCTIRTIYFDANLTTPTNTTLHNAHGILVRGDDPNAAITNLLIQGNTLSQIRPGYSEALTLVGNIDGFVVSDNTIGNIDNIGLVVAGYYTWACSACSVSAATQNQARNGLIARNHVFSCRSPLAFAAGIYADGSRDLVIEGNVVNDCQRGFQINCENQYKISGASAANIIIRNNLAYQNSRAGFGLGSSSYLSNGGKVTGCSIVNNSSFDNFINRPEAGTSTNEDFGEVTLSYSENCVVQNNSFHAGSRQRLLNSYDAPNSVNLRFNYNLWYTTNTNPFWVLYSAVYYGFSAYQTGTGQDAASVFGNPQYLSAPANLSLPASSAAINIGNPSATTALVGTVDYARQPRILAGRVDAGAYEFPKPIVSITSASWHSTAAWDCSCLPNPFDSVIIQPGHTLNIDEVNGSANARQVMIHGRLTYQNNGRLRLSLP